MRAEFPIEIPTINYLYVRRTFSVGKMYVATIKFIYIFDISIIFISMNSFKNPENTIFYQIEKAIKQYRTMAQSNLNKIGYSITINQILLLIQIDQRPDTSQVELAELLFKDVASITRMIELLVKREFLLREDSKEDRRKKDLKITNKGKHVLELSIPVINKNREIALENLSDEEKELLFNALNKIILNTLK